MNARGPNADSVKGGILLLGGCSEHSRPLVFVPPSEISVKEPNVRGSVKMDPSTSLIDLTWRFHYPAGQCRKLSVDKQLMVASTSLHGRQWGTWKLGGKLKRLHE